MKPLLFFDLETTGTDVAKDRIVSIAIKYGHETEGRTWLVNPGIPIPPTATECHGIADEMVKDAPIFSLYAKEIHRAMAGCDLCGFNLIHFDVPLLWEEFNRAGIQWDLTGVNIIDAGNIFKKFEERTLTAAMKFYCGLEHGKAHDALGDVLATELVLTAQLDRYNLQFESREDLAKLSRFDDRVDLAGHFHRKDGAIVFGFGKKKGQPVLSDLSYLDWMMRSDFPSQTKQVIKEMMKL